jgi:hypothetical protein
MVLNGEGRSIVKLQSLDDAIIERIMANLTGPIDGLEISFYGRFYGESMVVRGNFHSIANSIHHRLIDSAMAKPKLVSVKTQSATEELVTKTDSEERHLIIERTSHCCNDVNHGRRISRAVG